MCDSASVKKWRGTGTPPSLALPYLLLPPCSDFLFEKNKKNKKNKRNNYTPCKNKNKIEQHTCISNKYHILWSRYRGGNCMWQINQHLGQFLFPFSYLLSSTPSPSSRPRRFICTRTWAISPTGSDTQLVRLDEKKVIRLGPIFYPDLEWGV